MDGAMFSFFRILAGVAHQTYASTYIVRQKTTKEKKKKIQRIPLQYVAKKENGSIAEHPLPPRNPLDGAIR